MPTADTSSGIAMAKKIATHRPDVPVLTLVPTHKDGRLLQMYKCIHPVFSTETDTKKALARMQVLGMLQSGQQAVVVRGGSSVTVELATV